MTDGLVYDRVAFTWVTPEEMERRQAHREELIFQRRVSQGQLCAPMVISDSIGGVNGVQSQADGKFYDSKSRLRKHYKRAGVIEVGNDVPKDRGKAPVDPHGRKKRMNAIGKAFNRVGLPTT
ncbi:MAG: hypothetical protein AAGJ52_13475 [Pseudomonadota bacterium]